MDRLTPFLKFLILSVGLFVSWKILEIPGEKRAETLLILFVAMGFFFCGRLKNLEEQLDKIRNKER